MIGENITYEFHFYSPMEFTHQGARWITPVPAIGQTYPDLNRIFITGTSSFQTASFSNATIAAGTYDWIEYIESPKFTVNDPLMQLAKPTFVNRANTGKVWIDDIFVKEYDAAGIYVQTIMTIDVTSFDGWYYWSQDGSGTSGTDNTKGHSNSNSIYIEGSTSDTNLSNAKYYFIPKQGYSYTEAGWVRGNLISVGSKAMFRLDFEKLSTGGSVSILDKNYLAN